MMKYLLVTLVLLSTLSCSRQRCVDPTGERVIKTRKLDPAGEINLNLVASLHIEVDSDKTPQLEKIAQDALQKVISVDETSRSLDFFLDGCTKEHLEIELNATVPYVESINNYSAGSISSKTIFSTDSISFLSDGLGDIDFSVDAKYISGNLRNSGNLILNGYTISADFTVVKSGDLHAYNLQAEDVVVNTTGISVIEVYASRKLRVNFIKPGGQVKYRGYPEAILVTGVGKLIDDNL